MFQNAVIQRITTTQIKGFNIKWKLLKCSRLHIKNPSLHKYKKPQHIPSQQPIKVSCQRTQRKLVGWHCLASVTDHRVTLSNIYLSHTRRLWQVMQTQCSLRPCRIACVPNIVMYLVFSAVVCYSFTKDKIQKNLTFLLIPLWMQFVPKSSFNHFTDI